MAATSVLLLVLFSGMASAAGKMNTHATEFVNANLKAAAVGEAYSKTTFYRKLHAMLFAKDFYTQAIPERETVEHDRETHSNPANRGIYDAQPFPIADEAIAIQETFSKSKTISSGKIHPKFLVGGQINKKYLGPAESNEVNTIKTFFKKGLYSRQSNGKSAISRRYKIKTPITNKRNGNTITTGEFAARENGIEATSELNRKVAQSQLHDITPPQDFHGRISIHPEVHDKATGQDSVREINKDISAEQHTQEHSALNVNARELSTEDSTRKVTARNEDRKVKHGNVKKEAEERHSNSREVNVEESGGETISGEFSTLRMTSREANAGEPSSEATPGDQHTKQSNERETTFQQNTVSEMNPAKERSKEATLGETNTEETNEGEAFSGEPNTGEGSRGEAESGEGKGEWGEEEEQPSLYSAQIIRQQDAEEGQGWEETSWTPGTEVEQDTLCKKPVAPEHGYLTGHDYDDGGVVYIHCETGYRLSGPSNITCVPVPHPDAPGVWLPQTEYTCLPAQQYDIQVETLSASDSDIGPSYRLVPDHISTDGPPSTLPLLLVGSHATRHRHQQSPHRTSHTLPDSTQVEGLQTLCSLPKVTGPCRETIPRYYFNKFLQECLPFNYGGCNGNDNNFETFSDCQNACR